MGAVRKRGVLAAHVLLALLVGLSDEAVAASGDARSEAASATGVSEVPNCEDPEGLESWFQAWLIDQLGSEVAASLEGLQLQVAPGAMGVAGELTLRSRAWHKRLRAATCQEAIEGLGLSLVVFLETSPRKPELPSVPRAPLDTSRLQAESALEYPVFDLSRRDAGAPPPSPWTWAGLLGADYRSGLAPVGTPSVKAGLSVAELGPGWRNSAHSVHLGYQPEVPSDLAGPDQEVITLFHSWWALTLQSCPWLWHATDSLTLGPCVGTQLGLQRARAAQTRRAGERPFLAGEASVQLESRSGAALFQLHAGAHLPVVPVVLSLDRQDLHRQRGGFFSAAAVGVTL